MSELDDREMVQVSKADLVILLEQMEEAMYMQWSEFSNDPTKEDCEVVKRVNVLSGRNSDLSHAWWARQGFDK